MKIASLPINEEYRLKDLKSYDILDSGREKEYDDLVELASQICDCPIAMITFVDKKRQWFKASVTAGDKETSRDVAFCSHTILQDEVMIVADARTDERFFDNPLVTGKVQIGFYAGAPIISSAGYKLGTVCVIDNVKKDDFADKQRNALTIIARQVSKLLELRAKNKLIIDYAEAQIEAEKRISQLTISESDKKDNIVAYELTENLAQTLAAAKFGLECMGNSKTLDPNALGNSIDTIAVIIDEMKSLSKSLIPTTFQYDDYYSLIQEYGMQFGKENNIIVTFGKPEVLKSNNSNIGINLFKIVQNQLEISKICGAREIYIKITAGKEIILYFRDDTNSRQVDASSLQFMNNINTRVQLIKGELIKEIDAAGNSISIKMPTAVHN